MKPKAQEHPAFAQFWEAYGYKTGKKNCLKIWKRENLDAIADQIIAAIPAYDAHLANNTWLNKKHPSTWLNGEHWEDEYPAPKQTNTTLDAAQRWINAGQNQSHDSNNGQRLSGPEWTQH